MLHYGEQVERQWELMSDEESYYRRKRSKARRMSKGGENVPRGQKNCDRVKGRISVYEKNMNETGQFAFGPMKTFGRQIVITITSHFGEILVVIVKPNK